MPVPVPSIRSDGEELAPSISVLSIEVRRELNRIPEAKLVLGGEGVTGRAFALSNSPLFAPGRTVSIALRYEGDPALTPIFSGVVVGYGIEALSGGPAVRVELKDAAVRLTRTRRSAVFHERTDAEIMRKLVRDADLAIGEIATTAPRHEELIQYYCTDWDFLVSRADVHGFGIDVDRSVVSVRKIAFAVAPDHVLEYGTDRVLELELDIDGRSQHVAMSGVGWDIAQQALSDLERAEEPDAKVGNLDAVALARSLGGSAYTLVHPVPLSPEELSAWAEGRLRRGRFSMLRGRVVLDGTGAIAPFATIELRGVSARFDGKALVSAVVQRLDADGWRTELSLGLSPEWFASQPNIADLPAAGLLPPAANLQIGVVAGFETDPAGEHRIKVRLPALSASGDDEEVVWARVARLDAGSGRGTVFWPEPDDEVVLGFLSGDPRHAIVLGSLHSSAHPPPAWTPGPSEGNHRRAIVTRAGSRIAFDDEQRVVTIETPSANRVVLDDRARAITLEDQHGNRVTMSARGIAVESTKDLTLGAKGAVIIRGASVDVQ